MVMTLHDHWLTCANGGQRFDGQRRRCDELRAERCGACTAHMNGSASVGRVTRKMGGMGARIATALQARRVRKRWSTMRGLGSKIDCFLAPSRYLGDELVRFGIPRDRVHHSDYGFPTERFQRREDLPEVARRFAFIGSVMPHKGVHVLLEAFETLPDNAQLEICGFLDYAPDYTAAIRENLRHPGVRFVGGLAPDQVGEFLQGVDCLIVPSIWYENSPLTIHEAFMSGVPVVASRMGGQVELIEPGGGLLYEPDDPKELSEQLMRLYSEPGLVRRLGAGAPPVKSLREHIPELEDIYARLCEEKGRGIARP
jgi:glycosyltransferase involved in cell wall biosynthesis